MGSFLSLGIVVITEPRKPIGREPEDAVRLKRLGEGRVCWQSAYNIHL